MHILSLFDGISCGQLALKKAGISYSTYYASEIDPYAITITQNNFPNTIQLGDINDWRLWSIDWSSIDLILAGFPCQAWSVAGNQLGDKDPRGALFWRMLEVAQNVLQHNPKAKFLFENVKMKSDFLDYITLHIERSLIVKPHVYLINSALLSAQNRRRLYWTNIGGVESPRECGPKLQDILETGFVDRLKAHCLDANYWKGGNLKTYFEKGRRQLVFLDPDGSVYRKLTPKECERLQTIPDNYTLVLNSRGKQVVSNTQRYKAIGNAWTVDIVAHILEAIK